MKKSKHSDSEKVKAVKLLEGRATAEVYYVHPDRLGSYTKKTITC